METAGFVQLLTPSGERVEHDEYAIDPSPEELRGLYQDMLLTRSFDAEAIKLQRQGELALWPSLEGQEAAQIGSGRALRDDDYVFPCYREHGVAWCRGMDPLDMMGLWRGVNGGWDGRTHNFHPYTIVIGPSVLHAVGYAVGATMDAADSAVMTYFGDGGTSQGDVSEAFVFAAVNQAPVVFFCQNNQLAISTPVNNQARTPIFRRAEGFGFPGVRVDGNDVLAVLAVTRAALDRARTGQGPTLIEAFTYRMGSHTTSDDAARYRLDSELEEWRRKDPITRLRKLLVAEGHADDAFFAEADAEAQRLLKRLRDGVRNMPDPAPGEIFEYVYGDPHSLLDGERDEYARYLASFET
ncbi:pyruvate dehydrogenase (acetyl-transferring) E1 component subunit alpha [Actinoallomurus sp. NPDC052308]|uniref:pyruvate dehydrogenase (acetyl-transferring) E1 component subunit alpha n=1 Tax=Actinoallomurus sp. NPDC052308 TaxID=3155530 RepID=UPI003435A113